MAEGSGGGVDNSPIANANKVLGGERRYGDQTVAFYNGFKVDLGNPFFSREEIINGLNTAGTDGSRRQYGRQLLDQIDQYGFHSIGHLGLPTTPFYYLLRKGINTIPQLREALSEPDSLFKSGEKRVKSLSVIENHLDLFDKLVASQLTNRPPGTIDQQ